MQDIMILSKIRTSHHLTLAEMAKILKVSIATYKNYEAGIRSLMLYHADILSNYFNVSFDYLFGLTNYSKTENFKNEIDYRYLKFCIRNLRKRNGYTQEKLADELNVSRWMISRYENIPEKIPVNFLYLYAKKFHVSIDFLCGKSLKKEVL